MSIKEKKSQFIRRRTPSGAAELATYKSLENSPAVDWLALQAAQLRLKDAA